jgi:hypothetical protein
MSKAVRPPAVYPNYPSQQWSMVVDKTGAVYQTIYGRLVAGGPWGIYVFRTAPSGKPQQLFFSADGSGRLMVDHKELYLLYTDAQWQQWYIKIDGYIDPSDEPSSTIVDVNEAQVAGLKLSIETAQRTAQQAQAMASSAYERATAAESKTQELQAQLSAQAKQIQALQQQVNQLLTPQQVADLVWQKIKDVNYLYRLGFVSWPTPAPDPDVRMYIYDLVALIRKVRP